MHSCCLSVCFVEMQCSLVCYKVRLSNGIVIVCQFVLLKCSVRQSVTKSVCMPWRDHDVKKKGGLTIRPTWPKKQDTNPPVNHYFRSFCHFR